MLKHIFPSLTLKVERWKFNDEYRVYVSTSGNIKDEHKNNLPIKVQTHGYCAVRTEYGYKSVHRLVMLTWKPIPNAEELTVDHLNHNKRDNSLSNLEWVTARENLDRAKADYVGDLSDKTVIKSGKLKFSSYEEAAKWCIYRCGMKNTSVESIARKIENVADSDKMYCNRKWKTISL
jgi:hypothetical protein